MPGLIDAIPLGALIGIDASPFIYQLEGSPERIAVTRPFFAAVERGDFAAVTSSITLMEIAVRPLQLSLDRVADEYEVLLLRFPNLRIVDVGVLVARRAAEIRAKYRLRAIDSVHLAAALTEGATHFVTNDRDLRRVTEIQVLLIDDFRSTS
jgi:predicted nucleic acid-binding protein